MKVHLNFGAVTAHHSLYDELIQAPPEGIEYIIHGLDTKKVPAPVLTVYKTVKKVAGRFSSTLLRRAIVATAPKADLIQFCDHLENSSLPFVTDFEHAWSFLPARAVNGPLTKKLFDDNRFVVQKMLKQNTCKFLLNWTDKGKESALRAYGYEGLEEKFIKVPLAIQIPANHTPIPHETFNLLFLGTSNLKGSWNFYYRGGVRMLRVFQRFAKRKKDVKLIITGEIPEAEKSRTRGLPIIEAGLLSKEDLEQTFRTSDALFYPSYCTPGLAFLEAMRYHLPIITTDSWANPEIVQDAGLICNFSAFKCEGPYGILPVMEDYLPFEKKEIDQNLENSLLEALEKCYSDRKTGQKFGEAGFAKVFEGPFSIKSRNALLTKVYQKALE